MRPRAGSVAVAAGLVLLTTLGILLAGCGGGGSRTATIAGYLVDQPGGSAVENSTVALQGPGINMTTTTGSDGRFQFSNLPVPTGEGLPPKFYVLSVSKPQWATVRTAVAIRRAGTVHVTLVQLPLDPAFAEDTTLPSLHQDQSGFNRWNVSASDATSGLGFVGWLLDYDWGHVKGWLLNGAASFSDTFELPAVIGPGEHQLMFVAIDRAGNTLTSSVWFGEQTSLTRLDTPPDIVGAVALTITNSFLDLPPAQPSTTAGPGIASLSRPQTGDLLSAVYRATQRAGRRAGRGGAPEGRRVQPAALPPGSDAALFVAVGWRQASLGGVKGFRVYRDGRLALDYPGTDLPAGMEFYQTEDYAAELTPGQTATYKVTAFGTDKESAPSVGRSVVPLPV
ncbi:MAG TPA: carboxypeptidase regulatory-like domain-containing protein [Firmicutes bacterium]|nr:carboxypeptidase regulatory-like domain-containing protein [Bacillota bacterium]